MPGSIELRSSTGPENVSLICMSLTGSLKLFCQAIVPCSGLPAAAETLAPVLPSTAIEAVMKGRCTVKVTGTERNGTWILPAVWSLLVPPVKRNTRWSPSWPSILPVSLMTCTVPGAMVPSRQSVEPDSALGAAERTLKPKGYCACTNTSSTGVAELLCTVTVTVKGCPAIASEGASTDTETGEEPMVIGISPSFINTALLTCTLYTSTALMDCTEPSLP